MHCSFSTAGLTGFAMSTIIHTVKSLVYRKLWKLRKKNRWANRSSQLSSSYFIGLNSLELDKKLVKQVPALALPLLLMRNLTRTEFQCVAPGGRAAPRRASSRACVLNTLPWLRSSHIKTETVKLQADVSSVFPDTRNISTFVLNQIACN